MQFVQQSCQLMIEAIEERVNLVTQQIDQLINADSVLTNKKAVLNTIPGIGDIIAAELLILLPELGQLSRRQIASLVGLAPRSNDSGCFKGYRKTGHGRDGIKSMLFLAAMAGRKSKSYLKEFYERLIANGKKKKVALIALMRKILVIANARLRDYLQKGVVLVEPCGKGG